MLITDSHMLQIASGDMKAFKLFFDAFYPSLCNFCDEYVKKEDVAVDIAQEAMIELWRNRDTQSSVKQAKVYLYTIGRNKSINYLRRNKLADEYKQQLKEEDEHIDRAYIEDEVYQVLHQAVIKLPDQTRNIIRLALQGYSNTDIAEELGISINTVKTLKKSAYAKLRELLKGHTFALTVLYIQLFG